MPGPAICIVSGTLYDPNGNPKPNTTLYFNMPQQVIGGSLIAGTSMVSTRTDANGAIAPISLPQTAIVYVTIGAGAPIAGIVPASATGTIGNLLSGNVFGGPLAGSTVQVNGVNLQSQLLIDFVSSSGVAVTNPSAGVIGFSTIVLDKDISEPQLISSGGEQPLYALGVPGGVIGVDGFIHGSADIYITSILNGSTFAPRLYYGADLFFGSAIANISGSTQGGFGIHIDFEIHGRNNTQAQWAQATGHVETSTPDTIFMTAAGLNSSTRLTQLAIDSTVAQGLQLTGLWSLSDPLNSCSGIGIHIWPLK